MSAARRGSRGKTALATSLLLAAAGCQGTRGGARTAAHFDLDPWLDGHSAQLDSESRWGPEAALLVATPILRALDRHVQDDLDEDEPFTGGNSSDGNAMAVGLGAVALAGSGLGLLGGDEGRSLEVLVESVAVTGLVTSGLKLVIDRSRPEGSSEDSFPSNHSAIAFSCATYLMRALERIGDDSAGGRRWWHELGWLAYLPAAYVAMNRVEANRHYPSDVAAGAFFGTTITNVVFDSHYGDRDRDRRGMYGVATPAHRISWGVGPWLAPDEAGIRLVLRF